ncbi:citryl-CoA lyase [uncultured Serinicoccus sp.]|uniref:citryl-CoA lyase n=1 Tax=uncultured Serinicoccus sp. TaxID=735514 RepID=UPI002611B69A|nr:citryl-CoA lyase [uncultured Serinicoccus sp.]
MITTEIGQTTREHITIRGQDLARDLIGEVDFIDMLMLTTCDRAVTENERAMLNALMVAVMDHGFTPSSMSARLTYLGAPEAPQAAIAAGLLGAGSVFLGAMQNAAEMIKDGARSLTEDSDSEDVQAQAVQLVQDRRSHGQPLFGLGHNIHTQGDPRVSKLREVAESQGMYDRHWRLLDAVEDATVAAIGRRLPINGAGAMGACIMAMDLPMTMARGLALVARTAGLVAHLIEEESAPVGKDIWSLVLLQDPRNQMDAEGTA